MAETSGWTIHAAGEPRATMASHVGYIVGHASVEATYWRPAWPGLTWVFVALAAVLLAKRPGRRWPAWRELGVGLGGLTLLALGFLYAVPHNFLTIRLFLMPVTVSVLLVLLLRLTGGLAKRGHESGRAANAISRLAAALVLAGVSSCVIGESAVRPEVPLRMAEIERVAALTEEQAVSLGRWPTPEEWQARHGHWRTSYGESLRYELQDSQDKPWSGYTISCSPRRAGRLDQWIYNSRSFGPDGLFGTADDLNHLAREEFARETWPHGRAPRDPKVKLPPPPGGTP